MFVCRQADARQRAEEGQGEISSNPGHSFEGSRRLERSGGGLCRCCLGPVSAWHRSGDHRNSRGIDEQRSLHDVLSDDHWLVCQAGQV